MNTSDDPRSLLRMALYCPILSVESRPKADKICDCRMPVDRPYTCRQEDGFSSAKSGTSKACVPTHSVRNLPNRGTPHNTHTHTHTHTQTHTHVHTHKHTAVTLTTPPTHVHVPACLAHLLDCHAIPSTLFVSLSLCLGGVRVFLFQNVWKCLAKVTHHQHLVLTLPDSPGGPTCAEPLERQ
jgi:hypothetical protein